MERKEKIQFASSMLQSLECPQCGRYFTPPIYQCNNGHSICSRCIQLKQNCIECQIPLQQQGLVRNIALERMLENIEVCCTHPKCSVRINLSNRELHEQSCEHNPNLNCVIQDCEWYGPDLIEHLVVGHEVKKFEMDPAGGVRGWNSKTWKNADWGFSIWKFNDEYILNKSMSTGEIFYLYVYDLGFNRRNLRLLVRKSTGPTRVQFNLRTVSIRNLADTDKALPFHLSIKEAERHFLEPAEGLDDGYKRLSIEVTLSDI